MAPVATTPVDLVIPIKALDGAKSRLFAGIDSTDHRAHERLALAIALDTVSAAASAQRVRAIVVLAGDATVADSVAALGIEALIEARAAGLNAALEQGYRLLRGRDPHSVIGALQADLPALRGEHLDEAIAEANGRRAFCRDRPGTGTTLLLSAGGSALRPRFGAGSSAAHLATGAIELRANAPTLRCDVDTVEDLAVAATLGLGERSAAMWAESSSRNVSGN